MIFDAGLDFSVIDFGFPIFAGFLRLTYQWVTFDLDQKAPPLAVSLTPANAFFAFATVLASVSITFPSMILTKGMGLPVRVSMKPTYL